MQIRLAEERDLDELAQLFRRSVEQIGPLRYTPEQVAAWDSMPND